MINTKKMLIKSLVLFAIITLFNPVSSQVLTSEETVKVTTQEVLTRVQSEREKLKFYPEYIEVVVKDLIVPHFDFLTMAQLSLGKHWQTLNEFEQNCFTDGFQNLLVTRYADVFLSYKEQFISYESERSIGEKGYVSVRQIILHEGLGPVHVDYRMRPVESGWKVVDLTIEEVSLLKSYRASFHDQIKTEGLQEFLFNFQECK